MERLRTFSPYIDRHRQPTPYSYPLGNHLVPLTDDFMPPPPFRAPYAANYNQNPLDPTCGFHAH